MNEVAHDQGADGGFLKWRSLLKKELDPNYLDLMTYVDAKDPGVFPPRDDVFRALELTAPEETRVVIVGQDPYPRPCEAHGLCFSVRSRFRPLPRSLRTILRELKSDGFRASDDGNLESWACQGVLLLNTALTVQAGKPGLDSARWRCFTDAVIRIAARDADTVFLTLGCTRAEEERDHQGNEGPRCEHPQVVPSSPASVLPPVRFQPGIRRKPPIQQNEPAAEGIEARRDRLEPRVGGRAMSYPIPRVIAITSCGRLPWSLSRSPRSAREGATLCPRSVGPSIRTTRTRSGHSPRQ
jgi:uracil-DNA glycosylase